MRLILALVLALNIIYGVEGDSANATLESKPLENIDKGTQSKLADFFSTAKITTDSYAAFVVGYNILHKSSNGIKDTKQGMYFELDRGFLFVDDTILFGFSLDGTAGGFYAINVSAKLGARVFDGRIIPSVSLGYGLLNHQIGESQYNLHGASATISMFVDIASGFGLEVGYRIGLYPFQSTKGNIKADNIGALMLNFKFMDFSI